MSQHRFSRTELLIGSKGMERLRQARVLVFGIGGVGSYATEALARSGIGNLTLVDHDEICLTNINRQLHALSSSIGRSKVEVMQQRIKDINPSCQVTVFKEFYLPGSSVEEQIFAQPFDYIIDAIDTVSGKLEIINKSRALGTPVISAMGAGNKLDPTAFKVADISKTSMCPLAKVMRQELRKRGITKGVKVIYSTEKPIVPQASVTTCKSGCVCPNPEATVNCKSKRQIPGSIAFVPSVVGLIIAAEVTNDLLKI